MNTRLSSLDIFRALTMLLMIFVNDLWTIHGVPGWMEHTTAEADGMGLSDAVFPAFLFIVGLAIPFAIENRLMKGESLSGVFVHILKRSFSLILMGYFMVNHESFSHEVSETWRMLWGVFMILAFFLIWNQYPSKKLAGGFPAWVLHLTGAVILVFLVIFYRGNNPVFPGKMSAHWWGILGLIGWAYLFCASLYLLLRNFPVLLLAGWLLLAVLNLSEVWPPVQHPPVFALVVSASNHFLVLSGVLLAVIYRKIPGQKHTRIFLMIAVLFALICISYGFLVRPYGGISKIRATPSWSAICAGISILVFAAIYIMADIYGWKKWSQVILPAGQSTLTCYLLPGLLYPWIYPLESMLPVQLLTGPAGLLKCLLFALITIMLAGWLQKIHIRMKI
jgi:heparan-alpha-glucosaminide N-acetyltransferase